MKEGSVGQLRNNIEGVFGVRRRNSSGVKI